MRASSSWCRQVPHVMAFNVIAMLLLALAADSCASASAGVVGLPIVDVLPSDCGAVLTVQEGDTCESLA
jgi:hypothetical protein